MQFINIDYLAWDSEFFHKKIGKIRLKKNLSESLGYLLTYARERGYQLLYVFTENKTYINNEILISYNGRLVDRKVVYGLNFSEPLNKPKLVEEYTSSELTVELETLAYLSGNYSRFLSDKGFAADDFYKLYYTWIKKSIIKELADNIFIIKDHGEIAGMVTLKQDKTIGKIGLLAVSDSHWKKGYGVQLIEACKISLSENDIYEITITTQLANQSACLFYEKCGFKMSSITNIYHFWL